MIGAIARHVSIVAGFVGSLAAIVPSLLLWPRLSSSRIAGPSAPYYLLEMAAVGAIVLIAILAGRAIAAPTVWVASGLTGAFTFVAGSTIGGLYLPAAVLFGLSGVLADFSPVRLEADTPAGARRRHRLTHLLLVVCSAGVQSGVMAAVVAIGGWR